MTCSTPFEYNTSWEKVKRLFPLGTGLKILDLGCGDGRLVEHLVPNHTVFGLDSSALGVDQATQRGIQAELADIEGLSQLPAQNVDVILALDVLEHLKNLSQTLDAVRQALAPEGFFILSLPNHFDLRTRLETLQGKGIIKWSQRQYTTKPWEYEHIRFLTLENTLTMLQEHGLFPDLIQLNFMSQGLLPTRLLPQAARTLLVGHFPNAWSGKFVIRCRLKKPEKTETILLDKTPTSF